ncbi:TetR/AcrR family transcriptional regulator [Allonocardiopsis opalescens]|uniref:TetR family transcriptional regulator n=1 Tax=Allonocardiopsis opalescens TaxID=1144618 RepID=A0A2T0PYH3_9ACTN|nr:TetR/AcrR family transcriptional regulator C-terminal domain-containing protein [Allonocardiopsis opalescens]PRX96580.1 TetR family transcriptional regulator [Allonocardiopsis opalescens]
MSDTAATPFHVGLTPETVIDAAVHLTRETHLLSWSIRDLAARLRVAPSVIYHHVGGKDLLCRRVVERVLDRIPLPPTELDWQEWFRRLLYDVGPLAARYPGVAKWMLMHGPTIPAVLPTLEAGMAALHRAGFADRASFAYALLLNNAMLTISIGDDRLQHEGDGPRDHATMMAEFQDMPTASDQVRRMGRELMRPFAQGGESAARTRESYYRFAVDTTIAGLATVLPNGADPTA